MVWVPNLTFLFWIAPSLVFPNMEVWALGFILFQDSSGKVILTMGSAQDIAPHYAHSRYLFPHFSTGGTVRAVQAVGRAGTLALHLHLHTSFTSPFGQVGTSARRGPMYLLRNTKILRNPLEDQSSIPIKLGIPIRFPSRHQNPNLSCEVEDQS